MRVVFSFVMIASVAVIAACSSGTNGSYPKAISSSPNVSSVSPAPSAVVSTVPLAITTPAAGSTAAAIAKAAIPAPAGYTTTITVPIASATAGTSVTVTSGTTLPSSLPALASNARKGAAGDVRIAQASNDYTTIFYDTIAPSAPLTVAGNIVVSLAFPAGILSKSTAYYLGFYDSTQPSPAWQTIAGPVMSTDGVTLNFAGTAASFSLQANKIYGFAIFSLASASATPPPTAQTLAYLPEGTDGVVEVNAAGVTATTLPITLYALGLDDSGNIYGYAYGANPAPNPSGVTPTPNPPTIAQYAAGSTTATKTYTASNPYAIDIIAAGTGAFATVGFDPLNVTANTPTGNALTFDVWDAGASAGPPSRTIVEPGDNFFALMAHDGTLYAPHYNADGTFQYDVYGPGSSSVTRVIPETIVSAANQPNFFPGYAAVGPDGTLYVTEYSLTPHDPLAGLYIYSPSGKESFVATTSDTNGAGPEGVDVDASGNIYVMNNNATFYSPTSGYGTNDSLHDIEIFGPAGVGGPNGAAAPQHITGQFTGYSLAVTADGTIFFASSFDSYIQTGPTSTQTGVEGTFAIAAGTSTITQISSQSVGTVTLYDGNRETTGTKRRLTRLGASASLGIGGSSPQLRRAALERRLAAMPMRRR